MTPVFYCLRCGMSMNGYNSNWHYCGTCRMEWRVSEDGEKAFVRDNLKSSEWVDVPFGCLLILDWEYL